MLLDSVVDIYNSLMKSDNDYLKTELLDSVVKYARIRTDWAFLSVDDKKEKDSYRTAAHNALISNIDALARNMSQAGQNTDWRKELTDDRKIIGDWACMVHAYLGISMR